MNTVIPMGIIENTEEFLIYSRVNIQIKYGPSCVFVQTCCWNLKPDLLSQ